MNYIDRQYLDILQDILDHGSRKQTRAGEVLSVFDRTMRFDLRDGSIPLLTTKKVFTKGCIIELLWFLNGDTNIKYLIDNNVNIWTDDAYRFYKEQCAKHNSFLEFYSEGEGYIYGERTPVEKEEFIKKVKNEDTEQFIFKDDKNNFFSCNYRFGDLGDVYGKQWRRFGTLEFDQIQHIIDTLKTNPDDRRMLCVAYNPDVLYSLEGCALPPCHVMFQFWSRELSEDERLRLVSQEELSKASDNWTARMDELGIPKRELSLSFSMRSNDLPLGNALNLISYAFLLRMFCEIVNMVPGELVYHGADVHIYTNQIEGCKEQLSRKGSDIIPKLKFTEGKKFNELSDFTYEDFIIEDYHPDPIIKFPLSVG